VGLARRAMGISNIYHSEF
jgi:impB/mucB/samB family C-terminal domain